MFERFTGEARAAADTLRDLGIDPVQGRQQVLDELRRASA
jgi:uncharacterized caspase-like protein